VHVLSLLMKPWMATCRETRDRLSDYLDGDLGARTRRRVGRHLARCKHCQALLESLTHTLDELRSLGKIETGSPEPATVRAVIERIEQERRR
jgi:anti-sigma factor RsiW